MAAGTCASSVVSRFCGRWTLSLGCRSHQPDVFLGELDCYVVEQLPDTRVGTHSANTVRRLREQ